MLAACDYIAEDEQLIYNPIVVETDTDNDSEGENKQPKRVVLLEDFTGQRCTNCPRATKVIEELQEVCDDRLVAVAIHGGPNTIDIKDSRGQILGLKTETGDEYYNQWEDFNNSKPIGLINRHKRDNKYGVMYEEWATAVKEELAKPASLHLGGTAVIEGEAISIQVKAESVAGTITGKLQVWLIEDGIIAYQERLNDDGSVERLMDYVHNHVFRTAVNGIWGEDISVNEGEIVERTMTQALQPDWNKDNQSIVAFVYNNDGVLQTTKLKVETIPNP